MGLQAYGLRRVNSPNETKSCPRCKISVQSGVANYLGRKSRGNREQEPYRHQWQDRGVPHFECHPSGYWVSLGFSLALRGCISLSRSNFMALTVSLRRPRLSRKACFLRSSFLLISWFSEGSFAIFKPVTCPRFQVFPQTGRTSECPRQPCPGVSLRPSRQGLVRLSGLQADVWPGSYPVSIDLAKILPIASNKACAE